MMLLKASGLPPNFPALYPSPHWLSFCPLNVTCSYLFLGLHTCYSFCPNCTISPVFVKFYWNTARPISLRIVYCCTPLQWHSSWDRELIAQKAQSIYYLVLSRKHAGPCSRSIFEFSGNTVGVKDQVKWYNNKTVSRSQDMAHSTRFFNKSVALKREEGYYNTQRLKYKGISKW